jgi:hypothetical protein
VCEKWLQTLLQHARLASQEEPVSSVNEMPVNYEGNNTLICVCCYTDSTIHLGGLNARAG